MFQQLIQQFTSSRQGQTAVQRLQQQGFSPQQSQGFLSAAVPTAAQAFHNAQSGGMLQNMNRPGGPQGILDVGGSHYVTNFLSGAVSGLIRGNGVGGAAIDGLQGVAGGHVAQVIAGRFGLPQRVAGTVGAIVTPLIIDFLWERMGGGNLNLGSLFGGGAGAGGVAGLLGGGGQAQPAPAQGGATWGGGAPAAPAAQGGYAGPPGTIQNPLSSMFGGAGGGLAGMFGGGGGAPAPQGGGAPAPAPAPTTGGGVQQTGGVSPTIQGGVGGLLGNLFGK
jgi:hypothetical protein